MSVSANCGLMRASLIAAKRWSWARIISSECHKLSCAVIMVFRLKCIGGRARSMISRI